MKCYAHYANELRSQVMIALRQLKGPHTGENQAELILSIIKEFNLQDKIGYFVTDNAKNNDTAIDTIFRTLRPEWPEEQRKARRLRCLGHVINLAAQAFLYGKDIDAFEINMLAVRECSDLKKELELWRQRGGQASQRYYLYLQNTPEKRSVQQTPQSWPRGSRKYQSFESSIGQCNTMDLSIFYDRPGYTT